MKIPENIYATMKAVISFADERNIILGSTPKTQAIKLDEEFSELLEAMEDDDREQIILEMGDMLVVQTIICEMYDISLPECLEKAYKKIQHRKGRMVNGLFVKEEDL